MCDPGGRDGAVHGQKEIKAKAEAVKTESQRQKPLIA